ncbi:hypothetical protein FNF27_00027 [Cafeteria roenbergensis]|uniref:EF-hand domain-containing protein n=1 Tax=Cafeteria roenbergensis TaxID=33653 RepID=A0A5A8EQ80_CAFRO|nr:hypothetical protein FNF27_00027 [Cafeteria roenbergensis]
MASALSPRHAEVQELRAVEEYIRREREECEMLERQIVAMAVDAGIPSGSAAEEELGEDPYARPPRSGAKQVAAQGSAPRFKGPHAIAQTTASPGPGAYNTMHSDFSGCPGVVGAEAEAAESRVKAAIAGGAEGAPSPPKPAAGGAAADGAGPSHGGRRNPLSQAKLVAQLEASQAREKELRRQLASTTRRVDEARGQLTAFQNQTRTRLRDAEALAARRSAVVEAARGRVAAMRKAFAEIERAAHSLCDAVVAAEGSLGVGGGRTAFGRLKQLAFGLDDTLSASLPAFARQTAAGGQPADAAEAEMALAASPRPAAPPAAPAAAAAGRGRSPGERAPPSTLSSAMVPRTGAGAPAGVSAADVGLFVRRAVEKERSRSHQEKLAARQAKEEESIRRTVGPAATAMHVTRSAHPASGDGRPAESAPESPEAELQLTVEQKVRYVFAFYLGFGQRDKEINAMRHTGWARFTRAAGIVPHLLSPADVDIAFSKEVAHRTAGTQLGGALVFEQFIAALADLATRIHRGPEAAPDDEEDHNALRSLLESHVLPLFDELCNDATFIQEVVNVGATDDLEAFADEFLSPGVIAFLNGNKGALSSLFQRFAMIEDPGKPPRGSPQAAAAALASPSPDGVLRAMQERHAGWQELQRSNRQMSRWAFGQFISAMKLAPGVLNRRDLINIFRQANRGVAQDDFPDALSYPEFVEVLALVARSAYAADTAFVTLVDRLMLLFYDMAQRGADFVGEELRLVRSVSRVVKQRLAEAESSREADTQAAAAHQRSVISSVMASVDADSHAGATGTVSEPTTPEARP